MTDSLSSEGQPGFTYRDTWAKTLGSSVAQRLPTHCRISGSVARVLWLRDRYAWAAALPILSACHDVGKCSAPFVSQSPDWMADRGLSTLIERWRRSRIRHECFTQTTISEILEERGWPTLAAQILGAHHGVWQMADLGELDLKETRSFFKKQRRQLVELLESEFGSLPAQTFSDTEARYLAGAVSVADWIASNDQFFLYHDDYPSALRERLAAEAVARIGLIPSPLLPALAFEQCFGFPPNELQQAIRELPLDRGLYLIEADTGSGKTEAALYLSYRLIAASVSNGLYFALPTQLTSNVMLRRVQKVLRRFSQVHQRVKLCHGHAWLEERNYSPRIKPDSSQDGFQWFSTSRRGLLAPFGAGTIDQALLSSLKSVRHSAVRTFGLARKIVIVDEAHSYDRYTGTLLEKLASQCRELGSPLIVLSATLPAETRQRLCAIFGVSHTAPRMEYPLVTIAGRGTTDCICLPALQPKAVRIEWIDEASVVELAIREARRGQCVMLIRNTVRLAQATYRFITLALAGDPTVTGLIHSRFIQRHRRQYERRWTKALGKTGKRPSSAILARSRGFGGYVNRKSFKINPSA